MQSATQDSAIRRLTAAKWLEQVARAPVSGLTDLSFRRDLADGVLLCDALNQFAPGAVKQVLREPGASAPVHNLGSFTSAWTALGLPEQVCFSPDDFDLDVEERPQVAECVLTLKHRFELSAPPPEGRMENGMQQQQQQQQQGGVPPEMDSPVGGTSIKYASKQALHNTKGVTKLMQQCTSMLREKMWNDTHSRPPPPSLRARPDAEPQAQPESALEAMGPVLESVLGSLTQEYEKRLLLKDQDLKSAMDRLNQMQSELLHLEEGAQTRSMGALEYNMSPEEREEYERLQAFKEEVENKLAGQGNQLMALSLENEQVKMDNMRLDIVCREYQAKVMAGEAFLTNYKSIQDENRRMYNLIQDLRGNIRVFCRVRPSGVTGDAANSCVQHGDEGQMALYHPTTKRRTVFTFDKVFPDTSTQEEIYVQTQPLIRSVLDGYNVCIFAYGQTGSGKTHTMSGTDVAQVAGRGINYRTLDDLFDLQHQRKAEVTYTIKVQMLEVYNEQVRDLLVAEDGRGVRLEIQNTMAAGNNVPDAIQIVVESAQDVLDVMAHGAKNRATAGTRMNERSSRSHSVLTVIVDGFNAITGVATHGCLSLVDLAGSERLAKSEATGERLEEAKFINKSLSAIGDVMSALANKQPHIPFRNSKLTQLLSESLSGQAKVMMFVHVAPESTSHGESCSTLKFGARVSEITLGQAKKHVESGSSLEAKEEQERLVATLEGKNSAISHLQKEVEQKAAETQRHAQEAEAARRRAEALEAQIAEMQAHMPGYSPKATPASSRSATPRSPAAARSPTASSRSPHARASESTFSSYGSGVSANGAPRSGAALPRVNTTARRTSVPAPPPRASPRVSASGLPGPRASAGTLPRPRTAGAASPSASSSAAASPRPPASGLRSADKHVARMRAVADARAARTGTAASATPAAPARPRTAPGVTSERVGGPTSARTAASARTRVPPASTARTSYAQKK